ncbi:MAG: hypothetical protein AAB116_17075 [Candidatus Poribacteria bacterium]
MEPIELKKLDTLEDALSSGLAQDKEIVIRSNPNTRASLSHFLRAFCGRADLAQASLLKQADDYFHKLEDVRTALFMDQLGTAQSLLTNLEPKTAYELAEKNIEETRLAIFNGDLLKALSISGSTLKSEALKPVSRLVLIQLRGHAYLMLKQPYQAIEELQRANGLIQLYPLASSSFSIGAFLVQAYTEITDKENAEHELNKLFANINNLKKDGLWLDRLLTGLRSECHYLRKFGNDLERYVRLLEAKEIARWLNDVGTQKKCKAELNEILGTNKEVGASKNKVHIFHLWSYLERQELILSYAPKRIQILYDRPIAKKILNTLSTRSSISLQDLFKVVWDLELNQERYNQHLRAIISKIRKLIPDGTLQVKNGFICLR